MSVGSVLAVPLVMLLMATLTRPALRGLPEPVPADGGVKVAYAELPTTRFVVVCTLLAGIGVLVSGLTLPSTALPVWWVLAGPVLLLAAVDARTTWTPLPLQRVAALAMAAAALVTFAGTHDWQLLARTVLGASAAFVLFQLLWRLTRGGLGYGDVRAASLVGAATAAAGWPVWEVAFLSAGLVGTVIGVVLALCGRRAGFAFLPAMVIGAYLACAVTWL